MTNQSGQSLVEFSKLRQMLRTSAKQALEKSRPQYVQRSQEVLEESGDLDEAIKQARPFLGEGIPQWSQLLTFVLDVELSLDKLKRALTLLGTDVPQLRGAGNAGAWTVYHYDHGIYQAHAWLERLDRLVKRVCRVIIKPRSGQWREIENSLSIAVRQMSESVGKGFDRSWPFGAGSALDWRFLMLPNR